VTALLERPAAGPPPETTEPSRPQLWRRLAPRRPRTGAAVCGVVVAIVVFVQTWNIWGYPMISDDEGTYLSQAWAVRNGLGLAHYTYWYDHPPGGWIQIAGLYWIPEQLLTGLPAVAASRLIMPLVTGAACVLLYLVARRLGFARWAAGLTVLLFGLSPLAITLQRQIYLDNIAVAWILGAFLLALSRRRHLWLHIGAGAALAAAVLSKETILLALPAVVILLWQSSSPATRTFSFAGFISGLGLVGVLYPLYALLKGELFPGEGHVSLVGALLFQVADRDSSGSMLTPGTGANTLLHSWLYYDNVLIVGGVLTVVLALTVRRLRGPAVAGLLLVLMALRPSGYLPAMYVIQLLPFFALTLVGLIEIGVRIVLGQPVSASPAHWAQPAGPLARAAGSVRRRLGLPGPAASPRPPAPIPPTRLVQPSRLSRVAIRLPGLSRHALHGSASRLVARGSLETPRRPVLDAPQRQALLTLETPESAVDPTLTLPTPDLPDDEPPATAMPSVGHRRFRQAFYGARVLVVAVCAVVALGALGAQWSDGVHRALVENDNAEYSAAVQWIGKNIDDPSDTTIVVDDALWLDMVEIGFKRDDVIWFYKLDLDPDVQRRRAGDVNYILSTPIIRQNQSSLPTVDRLLKQSTFVTGFGSGDNRIEIRHVERKKS
jgi:uncharacterized membrane protein YhaH (DUF805 family)